MSAIIKSLLPIGILLMLAGCGGSGGGSGGSGVTVTPSGTQVLAGATQPMSATAADGGTAFTWQVNGVTGGASGTGTISNSGLYTAPNLPPSGGKVTITAIEQANAMSSGTATLSIGYSNVSLKGGYVFTLSGRNQSAPLFAIGEFNASGAGQISNGLQDSNNGASVQTKTAFTGSYSINPDGTGSLALGNIDFQLVMQAGGQVFVLSTTSSTTVTGSLSPQDPAAGSVSTLSGPLVLNASGQIAAGFGIDVLAGLNATITGDISGTEDVSGPNPLIRAAITGSYAFDGDGSNHGTLSIVDSNGPHVYSFYVISASDFALQSDDTATPINGSLSVQAPIVYSNASFNEEVYAFLLSGSSPTQGYAQAGVFSADGRGDLEVVYDINTPGNIQSDADAAGIYGFDASVNGRGTLTFYDITGPSQTFVFYMVSPSLAEFMTTNSSIAASGFFILQDPTPNAIGGPYGFVLGGQTGTANLSATLGTMTLDGEGHLSGTMIQNLNGSVSSMLPLSGSYSYMPSHSLRGTATLTSNGDSSPFAIYPASPSLFFLIGTDSANPYVGIATLQY